MKRTVLFTAVYYCLAASFGSSTVWAREGNQPAKGGKPAAGGGAAKHGGGAPAHSGGRQAPGGGHHAPAGGHHAPAGGHQAQAGGNRPAAGAQQHHKPAGGGGGAHPNPPVKHQPVQTPSGQSQVSGKPHSPSHQAPANAGGGTTAGRPGHAPQSGQHGQHPGQPGGPSRVTGAPQVGNHHNHPGRPGNAGPNHAGPRHTGQPPSGQANHHHQGGAQGGHNHGMPVKHHQGPHHSGIGHQNFAGHTVHLGNHPVRIGHAGYQPSYHHHSGHYHGYWNGNHGHGGHGGYGWTPSHRHNYRPYFWGLGGWGLGSLVYGSGYLGYSNPYYAGYTGSGYNYAQPIPVVYNASTVTVDPTIGSNTTGQIMDLAVAAFKQNNYDSALDIVNQGIPQHPDDAVLHEFRSLVLFAKGDYQQAAATIHSVLAVGPGWDWTTLSGLYADVSIYTLQLRALEAAARQNPQDPANRFLLAYHYISDGYPDAAVRQLQEVVKLVPGDQVAASLLKMTSAPPASSTDPAAQPIPQPPIDLPAPLQSNSTAIDVSTILGNWKASRDDGSQFSLTLTDEKTFQWSFTPKGQPPQAFGGTYTIEGNVIALEREGGGSLVAEIGQNDGTRFNFKMAGAPNEDPGLNFVR